jgi:hypothetical protein
MPGIRTIHRQQEATVVPSSLFNAIHWPPLRPQHAVLFEKKGNLRMMIKPEAIPWWNDGFRICCLSMDIWKYGFS